MRIRYAFLTISVLLILGCGDDNGNGPEPSEQFEALLTIRGLPGTTVTSLTFALTGSQVIPPRTTSASGIAQLHIAKSTIGYTITLDNTSGVTRAELFVGEPGNNGTVAAVLYAGAPTPVVNGVLIDSVLATSDIRNISLDGLMQAILDGRAYIQISTSSASQGLLRGQTAPSGRATITLGSGAILVDVQVFYLDGITSATLNEGPPGRIGEPKLVLFEDPSGRDGVNGTLISDVFSAGDITDSTSIDSLITLIRGEHTYINVTTTSAPAGALRGQIEAID
ncbi:MAG: hypothetical protein Kow0074_04410 [Candidatus Zixiibacteriota bacterium]